MRCTQTGKEHNAMNEQVKLERRKKITKIILVTVTVLFIFVMLVVPLFSVMASRLLSMPDRSTSELLRTL
jgi:sulfate transport system permease protein